jgi:hypothetical protein
VSGYLLDTNCISELVRPKSEPRVMKWMDAADDGFESLGIVTGFHFPKATPAKLTTLCSSMFHCS